MHKIEIEKALKLAQDLPLIQVRLRGVGLFKTATKMQAAVEEIGFEVAGHIEAERKERDK